MAVAFFRSGGFTFNAAKLLKKNNHTLMSTVSTAYNFESLAVTVPKPFVFHVQLNRPEKVNCQTKTMWLEIDKCFNDLHMDPECRVVVLSGAGKLFSAGIDFNTALSIGEEMGKSEDVGRKAKLMMYNIKLVQECFSSLERCNKPVLAAVHSACIGLGVAMIAGADIRYCTKDAWFQVKEIAMGMAADMGTLQRLPKIVGSDGLARELCYTGRKFDAEEAKTCGLITRVFEDKESMLTGVLQLAEQIASNSPVAVQVSKRNIVYSRDHSVQEGLNDIAMWNQLMLQSEDFTNGSMAVATKSDATFSKF